ncbi:MAG: P-loop NTPase [Syntrophobacterales bacterium]|jgi:Mrp family chromosome partitioning ATPase/predicted Fe-Mo cluster-binding NifX family protein|nr:P-loop NTPase [Syntrophobacterales bacterium]
MDKCPHGADPKSCGEDPKACEGCTPAHHAAEKDEQEKELTRALKQIRHKLVVMSGKGGVGKSSVAVSLALALARRGKKVGLMDVDLHGPNVLRMLGLKQPVDLLHAQFALPPELFDNLKVISVEAIMRDREVAVIWRGPLKHQLIRQFLSEVQWGDLDYLVVDSPPGTGDEPMSVAQTIPGALAVIVTTPQEISLADVRKSLDFCEKINMKVVGIVENMSGYACPHCGKDLPLFKRGGGERTARDAKVPFLGALPFDPSVVEASDQGKLLEVKEDDSRFFQALKPIVDYILETLPLTPLATREPGVLKFALPVDNGKLSDKFGHASHFAIFQVKDGAIGPKEIVPTPPHEPGGIPEWLDEMGITHVIAGTLGEKAQGLLTHKGIEVIAGAPLEAPETLVEQYLKKTLTTSPQPHSGGCQCGTA